MAEDTLPAPSTELVLATELRRLRNEVRALANWWDVLPEKNWDGVSIPWAEGVFNPGAWRMQLAGKNMSTSIEVAAQCFDDRLELTLRVDGLPLWQRAIFYGQPRMVAFVLAGGLEPPSDSL